MWNLKSKESHFAYQLASNVKKFVAPFRTKMIFNLISPTYKSLTKNDLEFDTKKECLQKTV